MYRPWTIDGFTGRPLIEYEIAMANLGDRISLAQTSQNIWAMGWQIRNLQREYGGGGWSLAGYRQLQATARTPQELARLQAAPLAIREYELRRGYQLAGLDMQGQQMALQWAQLALQREMMQYQYQFNVAEREAARGWQLTMRRWTEQDWAVRRLRFETGFGWQMEDYERAIRFARGRQRIDLMRERDRAVVRAGWEREDMTREETRQRAAWRFEDERYQRQVEYAEKIHEFERRRLDLSAEGLQIQQRQIDMQRNYMLELQKIEDQRMEDTIKHSQEQIGHIQQILALELERKKLMEAWLEELKKEREFMRRAMEAWIRWLEQNIPTNLNGYVRPQNPVLPVPQQPPNMTPNQMLPYMAPMMPSGYTPSEQPLQLTVNVSLGAEHLATSTTMTRLHRLNHELDMSL
jgi:hypothetical protein